MKNIFLKRKIYLILICIMAVAAAVSMQGGWKRTQKRWNSDINDIGRGPDTPAYLSLHYRLRKMYFMIEPHKPRPIVFLGDSMTDEGNWERLFPGQNVVNRGIGGDTTLGVLNRLEQIIELNPPKIFLMIGTNDLCYNRSITKTVENYDRILYLLHKNLPDTKIYVESVFPFNDKIFPSVYLRTNKNIKLLNVQIKKLAAKYNDPYLDITRPFTGSDGRLPAQYTIDGLHFNEKGYKVWRNQIQKYVKS
ncbi:GDSL-type esterase/lipase family protein [Pectinatus sottacetonis]|uniref:GDSL-type esterase/lipase family protein n=1 Tax=Pectinatus sottacetonis TaxID=1002795 RepID=UPI0018C6E333|nr:GDSL-type esterase/lipase family protein [Pectinatus sottacetonis]